MNPSTAVIIKDSDQLATGAQLVGTLVREGQRVLVFLIMERLPVEETMCREAVETLVRRGAHCFASSPAAAEIPGVRFTPVALMAGMLKQTDFVVPC